MADPLFDAQVTFCFTDDLERTAEFYERVLDLPLALDQGRCRIYRTGATGYLGFCRHEKAPRPESVILTLVTDDVDGWHERLAARGVVIEKPPARNPEFDIYHFFFRDPNGYLLEIQRFDDPRWRA
ncbi:MAG: VOC family protein [Planctomycetota bacterium]|jgi:catechol 2,3-dioxygenase-like lactoylglutathione lyase family enzyme